ncbi:MAG: hypothetical protein FWF38_00760 [Spirochaetaceae bacterium]|nr:hypothetical protein [Spirochaetaceae bacterium]
MAPGHRDPRSLGNKNICFLLFFSFFIILSCKTTPVPIIPEKKQPEKQETVVKFFVEPSKFYSDEYGYIGIGYQTKEEVWEKKKKSFENKNISQEVYKKVLNAIPKNGIIYVHIGRKDLMHANTLFYSFSGYKNNKNIFTINGPEGIPNIKGRDENWWNIVEIPLTENIDSVINVRVTDKKINREFDFKIIREEKK